MTDDVKKSVTSYVTGGKVSYQPLIKSQVTMGVLPFSSKVKIHQNVGAKRSSKKPINIRQPFSLEDVVIYNEVAGDGTIRVVEYGMPKFNKTSRPRKSMIKRFLEAEIIDDNKNFESLNFDNCEVPEVECADVDLIRKNHGLVLGAMLLDAQDEFPTVYFRIVSNEGIQIDYNEVILADNVIDIEIAGGVISGVRGLE